VIEAFPWAVNTLGHASISGVPYERSDRSIVPCSVDCSQLLIADAKFAWQKWIVGLCETIARNQAENHQCRIYKADYRSSHFISLH
jgi:hypothetical protein